MVSATATPTDARGCPSGLAAPDAPATPVDPAAFVREDQGLARLELLVRGARCAGCIRKIEGGLLDLGGVVEARLNLSTAKLTVRFDDARLKPAAVTDALERLGYPAVPFDPDAAAKDDDAHGRMLMRSLAVAGFATANVMLLSVSVWAGHDGEMDQATRSLFHWISALIAMPAAIYAARPFFASAWGALSKGRANMDVPISLAVCLALGISVAETLRHGPHAYFDAAVMLLFFLLIGRWLDHALRRRARQAARDLLALQATAASRIDADGALTSVPAKTLEVGDQIALAPGERAAADMVVVTGASEADFSLATGESAPRPVQPGDALVSGVVNLTAPLTARVTAKASDSFLADLARLVEAGEQAKTRYVRLADRAAKLYVPLVHTAAALVFAGWWILGGDLRVALINAIALLIITCPCALALAAPAVQVVATGRLFRRGVLVKSGDALERLGQADTALFDKTGTLTLATLRLRAVDAVPPHALETAAQLARASRHPIARAVAEAAGPGAIASDVREHPGLGLEAEVDGMRVRLGSAAWVEADAAAAPADSASFVWLRLGETAPIALRLEANLRPGAREAVEGLRQRGLDLEMLTGDAPGPAKEVADALAMPHWRAQASPQAKAARLDTLAAEGRRALMIGDGLNDAPALAKAHVSASPGSALEASQNAADFVIQGERLDPIVEALDTARAARRRTLENFTFAAVYNCCAVPLAAAGMVTPLIAALAMSGSSLIVTMNALRLARGPKTTETA